MMNESEIVSRADLVREIGTNISMMTYYEGQDVIPRGRKFLGRKVYTPEEAEQIRIFFRDVRPPRKPIRKI